ncbi:murein L,D-transpeptidase YcbB/YkuD [Rhodovulum imhoffii]|uniref:Murein L,D-transpeptidase YcbB/YkuD n=1 Tax=Rhodovulum imhoffii TaxID=365340 RepID=A0A2T5BTI1_9RHOB|nr:L,D-transpeptidase family protein [Rhodovulum imhoffii]MBK5934318.1 murein L,D-transpeptidase [Rhodovulum imhoffii]PTN02732.1 murein L,D-transpeptidase YcbB/YkuD [Rhodovulum imhoffii]
MGTVLARRALLAAAFGALATMAVPVWAGQAAFAQAVATAAAKDAALTQFYRQRNYEPLWTGNRDRARRKALIQALEDAGAHGLPVARYDPEVLEAAFRAARSDAGRGKAEVLASRMFLQYAQDIQTGVLEPARVVSAIKRAAPRRDRLAQIDAFSKSTPRAYMRALVPQTPEYERLLKEKLHLERLLGQGGWGPKVPGGVYRPGAGGSGVVALRNRLIAMGYMKRSASQVYDAGMQKAVQQFQLDHGLTPDGVAGPGTLEAINIPATTRLGQVVVAMERERWLGPNRGKRHVLVNITDFHARIIENGKEVFATRSVVGKTAPDHQTPEFSDMMEHMVINPTWNVPRSIAVKEYLPLLKRNPHAASHLRVVDSRGRTVSRGSVNFSQYTPQTFPYALKQPPSDGNALGLVKFMFPNRYNIYLHDTPSKSLFSRETRAFSHGCIRLNDPFEFAYELLSKQTNDPQGLFHARLKTGHETVVELTPQVPVHLIYRTAVTQPKGRTRYLPDLYGRDARIFKALHAAGVELRAVRG